MSPRTAKPKIPERPEYGAADSGKQLSWTTVRRWLEDRLYFSTSPETLTARNLKRSPHAVAHPESAAEAVIVHGPVARPNPQLLGAVVDAYESKYGWRLDPEDPGMPFFQLAPRRVLAWRAEDVRGTGARWEF